MRILLLFILFASNLFATDYLNELRKKLKSASTDTARAFLLDELTWEYLYSNIDSAEYFASEARKISDNINDASFKARAHHTLATVYLQKNQIDSALKYFKYAINIYKELGLEEKMASSFNGLGNVYLYQGVFEKALEAYLQSLRLLEKNNASVQKVGLVTANIGIVYYNLENYQKAIDYYNKALDIAIRVNDSSGIASAYTNLGNIYKDRERYGESEQCYIKAIAIYEVIGELFGLANCYANVGSLEKRKGKTDDAMKLYQKAMEMYVELKSDDGIAAMYYDYAGIFFEKKDFQKAIDNLDLAIALAKKAKVYNRVMESYGLLHEVYAAKKDHTKAYDALLMYIAAKDSLLNEENSKNIARMQTLYETNKIENELNKKEASLKQKESEQVFFIVVGVVMLIMIAVVFRSYLQKKKSNIAITLQKEIIEQKQKEIVDSINYAKRIQYTLLANNDLLKNNLHDFFVLFKPKDIVSGDFYWATQKNNIFYLAICDCTGHGVPGAFMSLLNISFLNEAINEKNISSPDEIFNYIRNKLVTHLSNDGAQDGMDAVLLRIEKHADSMTISYAAAHNAPFLVQKGMPVELPCDKMPVGKSENGDSFKLHTVKLQKGDSIYCYTDGYSDQFGGDKGKKLKSKNFKNLILEFSTHDMHEQKSKLEYVFNEWKRDYEQVDDVMVVGIKA